MKTSFLCVLAAALLTAPIGTVPAAVPATRVVITVDVESNEVPLPEQVDAVCGEGAQCGLMEIARLLQERHWSGTFFLNVYEYPQWGESTMRDIALRLQDANQDVALHTHPHWAYDRSRWAMSQYTLDEQTNIIRDGVRLLQAWTGHPVVAHRAGAYTANEDTLTALRRNGVLLDSSHFWQYPNDHLNAITLPRNLPASVGGVLEVPVTVYERRDHAGLLPAVFAPVSVVRKLDPNWFTSEQEMRAAIDAAVESNVPTIVLFLHSFSFISGGTSGARVANHQAIRMFQAMLEHLAQKHVEVLSMRDLAAAVTPNEVTGRDVVPVVAVNIGMPRYAWHKLKASGVSPTRIVAGIVTVFATVVLLSALLLWRRAATRPVNSRASAPAGARLR